MPKAFEGTSVLLLRNTRRVTKERRKKECRVAEESGPYLHSVRWNHLLGNSLWGNRRDRSRGYIPGRKEGRSAGFRVTGRAVVYEVSEEAGPGACDPLVVVRGGALTICICANKASCVTQDRNFLSTP